MVHIDIEIPRPGQTLCLIAVIGLFAVWGMGQTSNAQGQGGSVDAQAASVHEAEEDIKELRWEQSVLSRREEILQTELEVLEEQASRSRDPLVHQQLRETQKSLIALMQDQKEAEQQILLSLRQIWEAQGHAYLASQTRRGTGEVAFIWPIEPALGISAHFEDDAYERRFGMPHRAIDIPANQASVVSAAADGVVVNVSDNGMGFNSLVIQHDGGFSTLYGHVTQFLVEEGQDVMAGDPIALSGGIPGTMGAGHLTTGAHLHLQMFLAGEAVDPLRYLPAIVTRE